MRVCSLTVALVAAALVAGCGDSKTPASPTSASSVTAASSSSADHVLIVRALDADTKTPITGLDVAILDGPRAGSSSTSPSDQVPVSLPAGHVTLRVTAAGHNPAEVGVDVGAAALVEVAVQRSAAPAPSPTPAPPAYTFFGYVSDGLGSTLANVELRTELGTAVTNAAGRYEIRSSNSSGLVLSLTPPSGYEGRFSELGTLHPGQQDFVARRIVGLVLRSAPENLGPGALWGVNPVATFADGMQELLTGTREEQVQITCSNPAVFRCRTDGGRPVIEGVSPGSGTVTGTYWGVGSAPVTHQVLARR